MQVIVCIREALDWNLSTKQFRIDPATQDVAPAFSRYRIDQFDEIAVEVALKFRETSGCRIRALCAGTADSEDTLKHALSLQVDAATLVETDRTGMSAAPLLAAAIRHVDGRGGGGKAIDSIVLCGRTSSDYGTGQTGPALAEILGLPFLGNVHRIEGAPGDWRCNRETPTGHEVVHGKAPFVATVTNAPHNVPRVPTMKHVMQAHRMQIEVIDAKTLVDEARGARRGGLRVVRRYVPVNLKGCNYLQGTPREQAHALAAYIRGALPESQATRP